MIAEPYYQLDGVTVYGGDCLDVLAELADDSVDAVVTDPPYDLTMAKKGGTGAASIDLESPYGRSRIGTGNGSGGFMGKAWDSTGIAFDPEVWRECLRVLKPGGHLVSFGGTRTWHRLMVAVEDAGFEIRDSLAWLYGSGFPKSHDVSKAIDKAAGARREVVGTRSVGRGSLGNKSRVEQGYRPTELNPEGNVNLTAPATGAAQQWQGWGTALKPAFEPIVLARKPFKGTVAANVQAHGTGALNVDGCRVGDNGGARRGPDDVGVRGKPNAVLGAGLDLGNAAPRIPGLGRWPANVVIDEHVAAEIDQQSGITKDGNHVGRNRDPDAIGNEIYGARRKDCNDGGYGGAGGASRFFPQFRYQAKAPNKERPKVDGIAHPTVKPLELMCWLVRLVTPPGGVVLDPFAGSGTTAEACLREGMAAVLIERETDYLPLIVARLTKEAS